MNFLLLASDKTHPEDIQPNIVVPFANQQSDPFIFAATKLNLQMQGLEPRYEQLNSALDADYAYDKLFRNLWAQGEPFILVEHDILPWPGALVDLWKCECAWGAFQYFIFGELRSQLGCVKFDPTRLGACPLSDELVHWSRLDWSVITGLVNRGQTGHLHGPPVTHLNYGHQRMTKSLVLREGLAS